MFRRVSVLFLVVLGFLVSVPLVHAVGETCTIQNGSGYCDIPVVVNDTVNMLARSGVSGGVWRHCRGVDNCYTLNSIPSGDWSYVENFTSGDLWACGAACTYIRIYLYDYDSVGSAGNGVAAPDLPLPPTPVPLLGLFDFFDLGLTLDGILLEVVGFLSSPVVMSLLAAMLALIFVPRLIRLIMELLRR